MSFIVLLYNFASLFSLEVILITFSGFVGMLKKICPHARPNHLLHFIHLRKPILPHRYHTFLRHHPQGHFNIYLRWCLLKGLTYYSWRYDLLLHHNWSSMTVSHERSVATWQPRLYVGSYFGTQLFK